MPEQSASSFTCLPTSLPPRPCRKQLIADLATLGENEAEAAALLASRLSQLHGPLLAGVERLSALLPAPAAASLGRSVRVLVRTILLAPPRNRSLLQAAARGLFAASFARALAEEPSEAADAPLRRAAAFSGDFGLAGAFTEEAMSQFRERAAAHVGQECRQDFARRHLAALDAWAERVASGVVVAGGGLWGERLTGVRALVRELYLQLRLEELFAIIVDYPESSPAVLDLRECMEDQGEWVRTEGRPQLVSALRCALRQRVLHPGVSTKDLLVVYISTVRVLRLVDRTGVAQELVCAPIAEYLRSRGDVIREIIAKIIEDEGEGELAGELSGSRVGAFDGGAGGSESDEDEDEAELMVRR